jgi:hypothetical protein
MNKVYILQKDTIGSCGLFTGLIKAGARATIRTGENHYISTGGWIFSKEFVENNPEWFLEEAPVKPIVYVAIKNHQTPKGVVLVGERSVKEGEYYYFPYEGRTRMFGDAGWKESAYAVHESEIDHLPKWYQVAKDEPARVSVNYYGKVKEGENEIQFCYNVFTSHPIVVNKLVPARYVAMLIDYPGKAYQGEDPQRSVANPDQSGNKSL